MAIQPAVNNARSIRSRVLCCAVLRAVEQVRSGRLDLKLDLHPRHRAAAFSDLASLTVSELQVGRGGGGVVEMACHAGCTPVH